MDGRGAPRAPESFAQLLTIVRLRIGLRALVRLVEHGPARFEVAGTPSSKLGRHRNHDAENDFSLAVLQSHGQAGDRSVEVPIGRIEGSISTCYVSDIGTVDEALKRVLEESDRSVSRCGVGHCRDCIRPAPQRITPEMES